LEQSYFTASDKGIRVIAVQNPLTGLADDVAATKRAIDSLDGLIRHREK
jgi:hypothetical protein